jgi:hypothetical protein
MVVATRRSSPARIGNWPAAAPVIELISSLRLLPVLARHPDVEEHHVRLELLGHLHRLVTAGGFTDDLHLRPSQQAHQPASHHLVIIRNDDFDRHLIPLSATCGRTLRDSVRLRAGQESDGPKIQEKSTESTFLKQHEDVFMVD